MPYLTGRQDLTIRISDGPTDRLNYQKRCFGAVNGTNLNFKTFDARRYTKFTQQPGVLINGIVQGPQFITYDDPISGQFILDPSIVPVDGDVVEATYYSRYFLDAELDNALQMSSRILFSTDHISDIPLGLVPAAIEYAAANCYKKLAERFATMISSGYKVEDAPSDQDKGPVQYYTDMANGAFAEVDKMITLFYTRQGQNRQPLIGVAIGRVRNVVGNV